MGYSIQLTRVSIQDFKSIIQGKELLPSRKCLAENIDAAFQAIECCGIHNLKVLRSTLANATKLTSLAEKTTLGMEYLAILKREVAALEPAPVQLKDFGILSNAILNDLIAAGVRSTRDFFEQEHKVSSVDYETRCMLLSLCDLVRVNGIGASAAKAFLAAGYSCAHEIAKAEAGEMLERITDANQKHNFYKASLGKKDMQYCIDNAKLLIRFSE